MPGKRSKPKPFEKPARFGRPTQIKDGGTYNLRWDKNGLASTYEVCCDCQLVHFVGYSLSEKGLRVVVWRDEPRTQRLRSNKKN